MSSYFDGLSREIAEVFSRTRDQQVILDEVRAVEERLFQDVTRLTGDREFPDDLRQQALGILACRAIYQPEGVPVPQKAVEYLLCVGISPAVEGLHDLFHTVARRRHVTRFGALSDHPQFDVERRDEHDSEMRS